MRFTEKVQETLRSIAYKFSEIESQPTPAKIQARLENLSIEQLVELAANCIKRIEQNQTA